MLARTHVATPCTAEAAVKGGSGGQGAGQSPGTQAQSDAASLSVEADSAGASPVHAHRGYWILSLGLSHSVDSKKYMLLVPTAK